MKKIIVTVVILFVSCFAIRQHTLKEEYKRLSESYKEIANQNQNRIIKMANDYVDLLEAYTELEGKEDEEISKHIQKVRAELELLGSIE